ncbi:glycosyltransferase family 4 protein [Acetobacter sp.]|uniref:glycosyltransferase family 4 protein n=1 Tax=Acetobacter sp. TaxID=440 RepID=UPI0025BE58A7|nr:glycosyltransferase family 4 protein [Acetobacter sp.]MCH4091616.1 glycosyltransferase family 4 protein [Acetobacter sp.]
MNPFSDKEYHPLHSLWRKLPAEPRRRGAAGLTAWLAPKAHYPVPVAGEHLLVGGEINRASGLGEGARIMLRACRALGIPASGFQASLLEGVSPPSDGPTRSPLILHVNSPSLPSVLLKLGRGFLRNRRIIGYWAWELPVVPPLWKMAAGCVHEVWTPSLFSARALETIMPGRVRVVPHALAADPLLPSRLERSAFGLPDNAVVVLVSFSLASSFERKNPLAAIQAFRRAFGERPDRFLLLKVSHAGHYPEDMERLRAAIAGAGNIRIEERVFPAEDSQALIRCVDIVLSLHRSEGFGLVPAEAMRLGRTVVATDWSATSEFLNAGCGLPVPYRLVPARDPRGVFEAAGAVWAEADIEAASAILSRAADDAALRERLGAQAMHVAGQRFFGSELLAAHWALTRRGQAHPHMQRASEQASA